MQEIISLPAFRALCAAKGLAVTHQRLVIYGALMAMHGHPSPEAVYERVRPRVPSISPATVYKTIRTFLDKGLIQEVSLHHGSLRIEANLRPHHHAICSECRSIADLDEAELDPIRIRQGLPDGFQARRIAIDVIGICARCRARVRAGGHSG